jgi:nicotinamidase-related amidase/flavin reductase (DIM6/NTAB) family NADH-FMN oxidoreductase RutF
MGQFATGVTILLTELDETVHGMTANAVCSISLDPPLMLISLDNRSKMRDLLDVGSRFSVNVLSADQSGLADRFANRWTWSPSNPAFRPLANAPIMDGSLASVVCEAETITPAGDHTIVLGRVLDLEHREGTPLIFFRGKWTSFPGADDVFLLNRAEFTEKVHARLPTDRDKMALIAIDLTRGHLDEAVATMPLPPGAGAQMVAQSRKAIEAMRGWGRPVIHVTLSFEAADVLRNPFFTAVDDAGASIIPWSGGRRLRDHNPKGSPQAEIHPDLAPAPGEVVIGKRRYSAFFETDLDDVLRELGVSTVVLLGVNTNTSILHTALDALCRDYEVVVLSDCSISVYGSDLHELALRNVEYCVGWVSLTDAFIASVEARVGTGERSVSRD